MQPSQPERLLVVEDDSNYPGNLAGKLALRGYEVDTAAAAPVAIEKLRRSDYDLVVVDQEHADSSGLDLLRLLRATHSREDLPVIMVTEKAHAAVEALDRGANDYVIKPVDLPVVTARIEEQLSRSRPKKKKPGGHRRRTVPGVFRNTLKPIDPLTDLPMRRAMVERLRDLGAETAALLVIDLDGFQRINESFGQAAGDGILKEVARRIQAALAGLVQAQVARTGGDEFVVLLEGAAASSATAVAQRILEAVVRPMVAGDLQISVGASIGVLPGYNQRDVAPGSPLCSPEDLLRDAHLALYRAKELGKNRWHLFEPDLRTRARARMALVHDLRYAMERREFRAYYQPKVNLRTRRIVGYEALIRWLHPGRGIVYPGDFIELTEETGLIIPIGEWILREACRQLQRWQSRFPDIPLTMNVNLSVKQLVDPNLVERVGAIIRETGVSPECLNLELTETALMTNLECARGALKGLRNLRVGLKLDDFGTGYSSLGYLRTMHFDSLKIDKSFVMRMASDGECRAIVESIAKLARALEMTVVAEGIEMEDHVTELVRLGCEVGQGFYFSHAVEAAEAEQLLEKSLQSPIFAKSRLGLIA